MKERIHDKVKNRGQRWKSGDKVKDDNVENDNMEYDTWNTTAWNTITWKSGALAPRQGARKSEGFSP